MQVTYFTEELTHVVLLCEKINLIFTITYCNTSFIEYFTENKLQCGIIER
jgi:hypothetical protein